MESFNEAWELICSYCKTRITDVAYKTWISRISPVKIDFDTGDAILMVPNEFHKQTLTRCYTPLLNSAFEEIFGSNGINICFITPNSNSENKPQKNDNLAIDALRHLYRRFFQQICPRCLFGCCCKPRGVLQPTVYLWKFWSWQNSSALRDL